MINKFSNSLKGIVFNKLSIIENKKYILVQNLNNKIYLYNYKGELMNGWPVKLHSKILGEINSINYYNNQNRQILFNTKDSLYILDVKGRCINNYPIK